MKKSLLQKCPGKQTSTLLLSEFSREVNRIFVTCVNRWKKRQILLMIKSHETRGGQESSLSLFLSLFFLSLQQNQAQNSHMHHKNCFNFYGNSRRVSIGMLYVRHIIVISKRRDVKESKSNCYFQVILYLYYIGNFIFISCVFFGKEGFLNKIKLRQDESFLLKKVVLFL